MNLSEGTRRLALVLGGLGAIAGGVLSYVYLQPILHQRELHKAFEQLSNSDVVKEQRKTLQSPDPYAEFQKPAPTSAPRGAVLDYDALAQKRGAALIPPPPSGHAIDPKTGWRVVGLPPGAVLKPIPQHGRAKLSDTAPPSSPAIEWDSDGKPIRYAAPQPLEYDANGKPIDPFAAIATPLPSEVNKGGIATINWSHDYGVASIEITNGETLSPAPARWQYLVGALLPVL